MESPLISIVIPTYNSEKTLPLTLASIKKQTYKNIEIIVVDSYSHGRTIEIAETYRARIVKTHGALLWARYIGHLHARGEIELLLDSDQILEPTTIERGVRAIQEGYDALILEENSYRPRTITQILFSLDRRHVHRTRDAHPLHGVLLARMYRREILDKAFQAIRKRLPQQLMYRLVSQDHALIYYEAYRHAKHIGIIPNAVYHIEPATLAQLVRKFYRYGRTEQNLAKYYPELAQGKKTPRKPAPTPEYIASLTLWLLKAIPYTIGLLKARLALTNR